MSTVSPAAAITAGSQFHSNCRVTEEQLDAAVTLTGGTHPVHVSAQAAQEAGFQGRIFHGAVSAAIMAAAIGAHFRGDRLALLEQKNRFVAPVYPGDALDSVWTVLERRPGKRAGDALLTLRGCMTNQHGVTVLESEAKILLRSA